MEHFLSMKNLSEHELLQLIKQSDEISEKGVSQVDKQLFAANLFFEPSTRTKMSFQVAERRLGLEILDFAAGSSSLTKGESVYDTAKTFESIGASLLVIRHPENNIVQQLADRLAIPVINAGDGTGEHPTQSLLDLLTIYQEFRKFKGLKVSIVGDIKHSRVARSNAYALQTLGAEVVLSSKPDWQDDTIDYSYVSIDEAVETSDVVMLLRIQHERHAQHANLNEQSYLELYGLTKAREQQMKSNAIIMHPAPVNRGVEIDDTLVECKRSRIFKQMTNGVAVRMAVLQRLLEDRGMLHENSFNKREVVISR